MRKRRFQPLRLCLLPLFAFFLAACGEKKETEFVGQDFESWYPHYNDYIRQWLARESAEKEGKRKEIDEKLAAADLDAEEREALGEKMRQLDEELARLRFRQGLGDYFAFHEEADLPEGLTWENGADEPAIGDPEARKGGAYNTFMMSFPPTITPFGPNSNNGFRGELYDKVELALIDLHPETARTIPAVAREWAVSEDGRQVFFRLDEAATYSDGVPVRAVDFMWFVFLRASDNVSEPWYKQYFREEIAQIALYGESVVAVTLPAAMPREKMPYFASLRPSPPHFYQDYGPDYAERYQWQVPPTTGAYTVREGDIVKGVSVTLSRVDDWWAKDRKFYRHRYNADRIRYLVVRDLAKAWELFRAGEIDYFPISLPKFWYEDSEMPPVFDGYIERHTWYNQYPRIPWALYLNTAQPPLDNRDVRLGVHFATNWQRVIDIVWRGDASRLPGWTSGYGGADHPEITARPFSVPQAREAFACAGYTVEGNDGILRRPDGKRLEVILTYTKTPERDQMMVILKEEARKAGLDFVLDGLDGTATYKKEMEKKHQAAFSAWMFQPPYPRYYEYFHSDNAYDEKGNLKQNTNNVFSFRHERMDGLAEAYRKASTEDEKFRLAHEMQEIIHEEAVFVPGYMTEFRRIGCWRWMCWPQSTETEFSPPLIYDPVDSYTWWIDEEIKKETQEARRLGQDFPEVQATHGRYRN